MSRKVKQNKVQSKPLSPHAMDIGVLADQASAALGASRFREAIVLYKELIKRERMPAWVDGLASCYAGRAEELASKGMFKEALVLWRNRSQLCGKLLAGETYFSWLLQAGEKGELFRLLADKTLPDATRNQLEMSLAAIMLSAEPLPDVPADSALLRHRTLVLEALAAYHRGDFAALEELLRAIPARSPYRDLKPILKGLALLHTDVDAAQAAMARLPSNGPFERLAAVLRASVQPDWLTALSGLDEDSRQLVLDIKGCPDKLRPLLLELARLGEAPAAVTLLELLLRHRRAIPEEKFSELSRRLLQHLGKRLTSHAEYGKLSGEDKLHVLALAHELQGELERARTEWKKLADLLRAQPEKRLRAALIWRHVTDLCDREGVDCTTSACLIKSLELDPEDRESYLKLIRRLRTGNDLTQARAYLDRAQTHFPRDAALLLEAVEVALASKAFKKAVGLAKKVLELDPINPQVRGLIGRSLLSHARRQIKARNHAAANKELAAAQEWLRAPTELATLKLLRALASEGEPLEVNARLREAMTDFGGSLMGAFHLLLEAAELGLDSKAMLKRSGFDAQAKAAPAEVTALAHGLNAAKGKESKLRDALAHLRAPMKRAAMEKFSEADHLLVCEALQRIGENELAVAYSEAALKHWPGRPVFVYIRAISRYGKDHYGIPQHEMSALNMAAEEARKQGDQRTAARIRMLVASSMDDLPDDDPFSPFDAIPDNPRVIFELLLAMQGEKAFLDMVRKAIGNQEFAELKNQFGGNQKAFIQKLIDMMADMGATPFDLPHPGDFSPPVKPPPKKNRPRPES